MRDRLAVRMTAKEAAAYLSDAGRGAIMSTPLVLDQAADYLKLHEQTLLARARRGIIPGAAKPGKRWVFLEEGLREYLLSLSPCHSTVSGKSGTLTSPLTKAGYESQLELPTTGRRKSTTKSSAPKSGAKPSSERSQRLRGARQ